MRTPALWAAAAGLLLSCAYALKIAPGNAPDEQAHAEYVLHLSRYGRLPVFRWPQEPYSYEAVQPPAYYLLCRAVLRPLKGVSLRRQILAMRLTSAALHFFAICLLGAMASRVASAGLGGLGPILALMSVPMFFFIGAVINNDAAADLAGAALLYLATRKPGASRSREALVLGSAIGLALLCKITVMPVAAAGLASLWSGKGDRVRPSLERIALALAAAAAISGWFFIRNIRLYHDPTGFAPMWAMDRDRYAWSQLGWWFVLFFQSFWGRFGQMTQPMPAPAYWALALFCALAAGGWIRERRRLWGLRGRPVLAAALALTLAQNFVHGFFHSYQPQARYSFVALPAWAVLYSDGLSVWLPAKGGLRLWLLGGAGIVILAVHWAAWNSL